ncbi:FAD-dependent monooxygenase [uncultured Tateyamaria sp.]|uniref:FAD-dependent oxidoreductase n=1 Tax=uncultured Tateyamaria sp. TaxID=455651 RepID=UPI002617AE2B|nr:FAD-dependent monooxygenase [uncultured Tateyamaria sp.]
MSENIHEIVQTDVLIVGLGPAGATMSALLGQYGVKNLAINMWSSTAPTPRAHITNQRAMEILRDLGLEDAAKDIAVDQKTMGDLVLCSSLAGEEFGRKLTWHTHPENQAQHDLASPTAVCDIPQTLMEPLILGAAQRAGSSIRFETKYLSHTQDENGVAAELEDTVSGRRYTVKAKYMVGADGGNSQVAKDLDLPLEGKMGLAGSMNIHFKADLSSYVAHRPADMYWVFQPGEGLAGHGVGVLRMVKPWTDWVGVWGYDIQKGPPELTDDMARSIVHKLIGDDSVDVELGTFNTWTVNKVFAKTISKGRVFCMGDAIHRHPPMNGLGSNTSMADAYNLAWKLAAAVNGQAGEALLSSYQDERQPVGEYVVNRAFASMGLLPPILGALGLATAPDPESMKAAMEKRKTATEEGAKQRAALRGAIDGLSPGFSALGAELNQRYDSSAVVSDGSEDVGFSEDRDLVHQPNTRPGSHLRHVWLEKDQRLVSSFDLCGKGQFTILTGIGGEAWVDAAAAVKGATGVEITVHVIGAGQEYKDAYGDFARTSETEETGALLVRPDMFIGWRAGDVSKAVELVDVMKQVLGLTAASKEIAAE